MRNTWLAEQLQSISEEPNSFIIEEPSNILNN